MNAQLSIKKFLRRDRGFTLIEIMIVVAIIGILASIAVPAYQKYILKSHRVDAETYLMNLAQLEQQYFLDARAYATTIAALNTTTPSSITPYYTINAPVIGASPPSFSITATPIGSQTADSCGALTINSDGSKTAASGSNCW